MPIKRIVLGVALTLLVGLASIGGYLLLTDETTAQGGGKWWAVAGGPEGFELAEWGTGKGPGVSLDLWIESIPKTCDIQLIDRGNGFISPMVRCPD